jgi:hypothetical protein
VLEECARFNQDVVAPLNEAGDRHPSTFKDGKVATTPGFKEALSRSASCIVMVIVAAAKPIAAPRIPKTGSATSYSGPTKK